MSEVRESLVPFQTDTVELQKKLSWSNYESLTRDKKDDITETGNHVYR